MLSGIGSVATWTAGAASIGDLFPSQTQGSAYAKVLAATGVISLLFIFLTNEQIGSMAGPIVGGALTQLSGGRKDVPFLVILSLVIIDGICRIIMQGNITNTLTMIEPKKASESENKGSGYSYLLREVNLVMTSLIGTIDNHFP